MEVASLLLYLSAKNITFVWSEDCQGPFDNLKLMLTNEFVLSAPEYQKQFKIAIDASKLLVYYHAKLL